MSRKSKDEAEKTRARILASALTLFVRNGYEKTTFTDIAARLKMTKGAVYWHFESKEALLIALVDEMLASFAASTLKAMPKEDFTFEAVSKMMVETARLVLKSPKGRAYFLLMHTQIRWSDATMDRVREDLLTNQRFGPWHAFVRAVENDIAAGRAKADTDPEAVACVCMSIRDGLVQGEINGFHKRDMGEMLTRGFAAIGQSIAAPSRKEPT